MYAKQLLLSQKWRNVTVWLLQSSYMKGHITIYLLIEAGSVIQAGSQKCLEFIAGHLE